MNDAPAPPVLAFESVSKRYAGAADTPEGHALTDVTFSVRRGEIVGVVGGNGAGKSTLLGLASGILSPTTGAVRRAAPVSPLLSLSAGFSPELTGRENLDLLHRLTHPECSDARRFDGFLAEVLEVAELPAAILEKTVRTLSSGQAVRLAFAAATRLSPGIFLIDEVLSVGDTNFQKKSFEIIRAMTREATCALVVSHSLSRLAELADRFLLLDRGHLIGDGRPGDVIAALEEADRLSRHARSPHATRPHETSEALREADRERVDDLATTADRARAPVPRESLPPFEFDDTFEIRDVFALPSRALPALALDVRVEIPGSGPSFSFTPRFPELSPATRDRLMRRLDAIRRPDPLGALQVRFEPQPREPLAGSASRGAHASPPAPEPGAPRAFFYAPSPRSNTRLEVSGLDHAPDLPGRWLSVRSPGDAIAYSVSWPGPPGADRLVRFEAWVRVVAGPPLHPVLFLMDENLDWHYSQLPDVAVTEHVQCLSFPLTDGALVADPLARVHDPLALAADPLATVAHRERGRPTRAVQDEPPRFRLLELHLVPAHERPFRLEFREPAFLLSPMSPEEATLLPGAALAGFGVRELSLAGHGRSSLALSESERHAAVGRARLCLARRDPAAALDVARTLLGHEESASYNALLALLLDSLDRPGAAFRLMRRALGLARSGFGAVAAADLDLYRTLVARVLPARSRHVALAALPDASGPETS